LVFLLHRERFVSEHDVGELDGCVQLSTTLSVVLQQRQSVQSAPTRPHLQELGQLGLGGGGRALVQHHQGQPDTDGGDDHVVSAGVRLFCQREKEISREPAH